MLTYQRNNYPNDKGLSRIITEGNDFENNCSSELNEITILSSKVKLLSKSRLVRSATK